MLISNKRESTPKKSLYVWVPVWGEKHINWFFKYTLPSLLEVNNLPAVSNQLNVKIFFYTKDEDLSLISKKMSQNSCSYEYSVFSESNFKDRARDMMSNYIIHMLDECIKNDALMLVAHPDLIFSNGTVSNLVELSKDKGVSVAVSHARVAFEELIEKQVDISNTSSTNLVNLVLDYGHETLSLSNEVNDLNSTQEGIAIRHLSNGLAVIHNLPAVYLCNPTKYDLKFFRRRPCFNMIDKTWPHLLFRQSRLKVVASSDIAFIIELTAAEIKAKVTSGMKFNDQYYGFRPIFNYANVIVGLWRKK